jgi:hypothetical protein
MDRPEHNQARAPDPPASSSHLPREVTPPQPIYSLQLHTLRSKAFIFHSVLSKLKNRVVESHSSNSAGAQMHISALKDHALAQHLDQAYIEANSSQAPLTPNIERLVDHM